MEKIVIKELNKDNIIVKLADEQMLGSISEESAKKKVNDMTAVYYYAVELGNDRHITIPIPSNVLEELDISEDALWELAVNNAVRRNPLNITTFGSFTNALNKKSCFVHDETEVDTALIEEELENMCVVYGKYTGGTVAMYHTETMDRISGSVNDDLVIIPCSPDAFMVCALNWPGCRDMVVTITVVHEFVLKDDTRVSKSVYLYHRDSKTLSYQNVC